MQIDLTALPDDTDILQRMLREVVPELQAENEKLWQLVQRLLRHRFGPRSEQLDLDQLQLGLEDAEQGAAEDEAAKDAAEPSERRRRSQSANRPIAIAARYRHICRATRLSSISRARNVPAAAVRCT